MAEDRWGSGLGAWEFSDRDEKALAAGGRGSGSLAWPPQVVGATHRSSVPSPCGNSQHAPESPRTLQSWLAHTACRSWALQNSSFLYQQIYSRGRGSPAGGGAQASTGVGPFPHHPGAPGRPELTLPGVSWVRGKIQL